MNYHFKRAVDGMCGGTTGNISCTTCYLTQTYSSLLTSIILTTSSPYNYLVSYTPSNISSYSSSNTSTMPGYSSITLTDSNNYTSTFSITQAYANSGILYGVPNITVSSITTEQTTTEGDIYYTINAGTYSASITFSNSNKSYSCASPQSITFGDVTITNYVPTQTITFIN
jgi:hypothetical protein